MFEQLGPTPRVCIDFLLHPEQGIIHRAQQNTVLAELDPNMVTHMFATAANLDMDPVLDKVALIRRSESFSFRIANAAAVTHYVKQRIVIATLKSPDPPSTEGPVWSLSSGWTNPISNRYLPY